MRAIRLSWSPKSSGLSLRPGTDPITRPCDLERAAGSTPDARSFSFRSGRDKILQWIADGSYGRTIKVNHNRTVLGSEVDNPYLATCRPAS